MSEMGTTPETQTSDQSAARIAVGELVIGLEEQAGYICWLVGAWQDLGYGEPLPFPAARPIPPLGERPAKAIEDGHKAIREIDELSRQLYRLRERLVGELREDEDIRVGRVDELLASRRAMP